MDTSSEVNQHPAAPIDLRSKLNKMRSKVTSPNGDPESLRVDSSQKRARGHLVPTHKENAFPENTPRGGG